MPPRVEYSSPRLGKTLEPVLVRVGSQHEERLRELTLAGGTDRWPPPGVRPRSEAGPFSYLVEFRMRRLACVLAKQGYSP